MSTTAPDAEGQSETSDPDTTDERTREADEHDADAAHRADRPSTTAEDEVADTQAEDMPATVGEHYKEMAEIGREVEGEGRIGG